MSPRTPLLLVAVAADVWRRQWHNVAIGAVLLVGVVVGVAAADIGWPP